MGRLPHRWCTFVVCLCYSLINSFQPAHAGVTEWMDIRVVDGNLMVETEVAGIAGLSIVDTGATATSINGRFLESEGLSFKNGPKVTVTGVFGKSKRSTYLEIPGAIFGAPVTFLDVVDLDLGAPDIQFLLGANFLKGFVFQFDYTNERMRLITRDTVDLKAIQNVDAKKDRDGGSMVVRVNLNNDANAWLLMDTGSTGGILIERSLARRLDWIETNESVDGVSSGVISSGEMEYFRVPSIEVGPFTIENVRVSMPAEGESLKFFDTITPTGSRFARRNASDGILGYDILQHFVVTIDYDRGYVHFYPGEKIPAE
jgi:predicted aspartyl protease